MKADRISDLEANGKCADLEVKVLVGADRQMVGDLLLATQQDLRVGAPESGRHEGRIAEERLEGGGEVDLEHQLEVLTDRKREPRADVERQEHAPAAVGGGTTVALNPACSSTWPPLSVAVGEAHRCHTLQRALGSGAGLAGSGSQPNSISVRHDFR